MNETTQLGSRNERTRLNRRKQLNLEEGTKQLNSAAGTKQLDSAPRATACNRLYSRENRLFLSTVVGYFNSSLTLARS
ncbi:hypothetical protein TNCV_229721 [Trichonephila clavipes]|nr:hypothetical protein TNCV_229721 [Trichonephila clavipes]